MIGNQFVPNASVPTFKRSFGAHTTTGAKRSARPKLSPAAFDQRVVAKRQARETVSLGTNLSGNTFASKLAARREARRTAAIGTKADVVDTFESKLAARRAVRRTKAVGSKVARRTKVAIGCPECGGTCGGNKSDADKDEDEDSDNPDTIGCSSCGGQKKLGKVKGFESDSDSDSGSISF